MASNAARRVTTRAGRSGRLLGARNSGLEYLPHFAIGHALLVSTLRVVSYDAPPEGNGDGIAKILGDLPAAREAIQDELDGEPADAAATPGARDEEFRHPVVDG